MKNYSVYYLLYLTLLDIREMAHETDSRILRLVDAFHGLPLELEALARQDITEEQVRESVKTRAEMFGLQRWLQNQIDNNM